MTELRARAGDLRMADAMPFQQHHEYRTTHGIREVLNERYFLNLRSNLRVGDTIAICRYVDQSWERLAEVADVRVVEIGSEGVRLHLRGEAESIPGAEDLDGQPAANHGE